MAVYILHFDKKFHHAQHYIGFTEKNTLCAIWKRLQMHKCGKGSKLLRSVVKSGINVNIAKFYLDGDRKLERALKNKHKTRAYCPICSGEANERDNWKK